MKMSKALAQALAVMMLWLLTGCGGAPKHPQCKADFDLCMNHCAPQCGANDASPTIENPAETYEDTPWDSATCDNCITHCREQGERCEATQSEP